IFESKYLLLLLVSVVIGLTVFSISAFRESRRVTARRNEAISVVIEELKELKMGETNINTGQAGVVGSHGHAHDISMTQGTNLGSANIDLKTLAEELSKLLPQLAAVTATTEHYTATGEVAKARDAAADGDGPEALKCLAKAGR